MIGIVLTLDSPRPFFAGLQQLLVPLRDLWKRPPFAHRDEALHVRGDVPLPLVCLVGESSAHLFLEAWREELNRASPRVPHALVDATTAVHLSNKRWEPAQPRNAPLLPLLDNLSFQLSADAFGAGLRRLRFYHYMLADVLTTHELPPPQRDARSGVRTLLRQWTSEASGSERAAPIGAELAEVVPSGFFRLALRLLVWVGHVVLFRWLEQRPATLRRQTRWFMRGQPFMVPRHSNDFLGFAERLTTTRRDGENLDQIKKLLVHAFLEDLRVAYRRRRWLFFPRRAGFRRTAYVTVLIDHARDDNGGFELLELINAVRNETGELDPLLVVAGCATAPVQTAPIKVSGVADALARWRTGLPKRRQRLATDARYVVVKMPQPVADDRVEGLPAADENAWEPPGGTAAPKPSWPARRFRLELVLVLLLLAGLIVPFFQAQEFWGAQCSYLRRGLHDGVALRMVDVAGDRQCVGYSDDQSQIFGTNVRLRQAQQRIFDLNDDVADKLEESPQRATISLIYFAGLTHAGSDLETDHAVAEELEGIELAQQQQYDANSASEPLLRVIVANGGREMAAADTVARDLLIPLAQRDPSIKAVVGLDRTVPTVERAISDLGEAAVPTIGTTLTGTGLKDRSPLYFQMVPGNVQEAKLIDDYVEQRRATKGDRLNTVHIVFPASGVISDTYVQTLVGGVDSALRERGKGDLPAPKVDRIPLDSVAAPCKREDWAQARDQELYFYAGREDEYRDFLSKMFANCGDSSRWPQVIADDAVTRTISQPGFRNENGFDGVKVQYVGLGSLVVLGGNKCVNEGVPDEPLRTKPELATFCTGYHKLRERLNSSLPATEQPGTTYPGERVGVAYDASRLLLAVAVGPPERYRWHRAALMQLVREPGFRFIGATGLVDFTQTRTGDDRSIAILELEIEPASSAVQPQPTCVFLIGNQYEKPVAGRAPVAGCPK
jgi:hypothetical protein